MNWLTDFVRPKVKKTTTKQTNDKSENAKQPINRHEHNNKNENMEIFAYNGNRGMYGNDLL